MFSFYEGGSLLLREPKKRQIISNLINKKIVDKNKNFIDGGSFLGDTSLPLCLNINGLVYSIDPGDINVSIIEKLSNLNNIDNIVILKYCLGDKYEKLFYNEGIYGINFNSFNTSEKLLGNHIYSISLDELYRKKIIENIDFIHIDVENLESKVLHGSELLIKDFSPIIIFEGHIKSNQSGVKECIDFLNNIDYINYMIDEDAGAIDDAKNFISIPKNRHTEFKNNFDFFHFLKEYNN